MSLDLEGNVVLVGHTVYICDKAIMGSKSRRLLCGEVKSINEKRTMCQVYVHENGRTYNKRISGIIRPLQP